MAQPAQSPARNSPSRRTCSCKRKYRFYLPLLCFDLLRAKHRRDEALPVWRTHLPIPRGRYIEYLGAFRETLGLGAPLSGAGRGHTDSCPEPPTSQRQVAFLFACLRARKLRIARKNTTMSSSYRPNSKLEQITKKIVEENPDLAKAVMADNPGAVRKSTELFVQAVSAQGLIADVAAYAATHLLIEVAAKMEASGTGNLEQVLVLGGGTGGQAIVGGKSETAIEIK